MPGRFAIPTPVRVPRLLPVLGFLLAGVVVVSAADDDVDDKSPLPPTEPMRAVVEKKLRVPNPDARIFKGGVDPKTGLRVPKTGIVDFEKVASERDNSDEYQAWNVLVRHASQFPAAELEEHAGRDLTYADLTGPPRFVYRLELLRFDGKLGKVRRLTATRVLRDAGIAEVYEAIVAPVDEPPGDAIAVVFTDLPAALAGVKDKPLGEWLETDVWAAAAGYFFKAKQDSPQDAAVPVLIGKSVNVLPGPPAGPDPNNPAALNENLRVFQFIGNDESVAKGEENWAEVAAWNRVLLHARRFEPDELEKHARSDLTFADLFLDGRRELSDGRKEYKGPREYKLDLVRFEGRLILLKKMDPGRKLNAAGVPAAYEGWLVPRDEPSGNPICVVFTDPPEGVEPGGRVNKWVSFAGYAFKLMRYESGERDPKDAKRFVVKKAPLLLGRAVIARPDPDAPGGVSWGGFLTGAFAAVAALLGTALALAWWFRRGDRSARREIDSHRAKNPFGDPAG